MITTILPYVSSYADVRAATGLNELELPDVTLALAVYYHQLGLELNSISGVYTPITTAQTLQVIYDRPVPSTDPMFASITLFSIYTVAAAVLTTVGLAAFKLQADGKSTLGRFSPESTYLGTVKAVNDKLDEIRQDIYELLGTTVADIELVRTIPPDVDLVTGE